MSLLSRICRRSAPASDEAGGSARSLPPETPLPALPEDPRYCRLLTGEDASSTTPEQITAAWEAVEQRMSVVPGGDVPLQCLEAPMLQASEDRPLQDILLQVESFYIDRFAVTNDEFLAFVEAGGYGLEQIWPPDILPMTLQFVDSTGCPGPRFWAHGKPPAGLGQHPVVGVSWYEAYAYACWIGKRLPTSAEWQRAGTWSAGESGVRLQPRYPWGDSFDAERANTWNGGPGTTVPVHCFYSGATPNGIYQLVGNVWEWVATRFEFAPAANGLQVTMEQPMAEVRGGAFDTYFASQATCRFRTGHPLLYRGANVGFRCCVSRDQLQLSPDPYAFLQNCDPS